MSESPEESQRSRAHRDGTERHDRLEQADRRVGAEDRRVASAVKRMARDLQDLAAVAEEEAVGQILAATARVGGETTQSGILLALLEEGRRFASRTAFFLTRPGEVRGWAGRGFATVETVERTHFDYEGGSVWERMATQTGAVYLNVEESAAVCRSLDAPAGGPGVLIPFVLRGHLGGALYADRPEGEGALGIASLQLLTHSAAQAIETAALSGGGGSPALRFSSEASAKKDSIPFWKASEAPAPAAEPAPAAAVEEAVAEEEAAPAIPATEERASISEEPVLVDAAEETAAEETAAEYQDIEGAGAAEAGVEPALEVSTVDAPVETEAVDFEMVTTTDLEEEIPPEPEPEPELDDTSDLWAVEEEETAEEDEEEETFVSSVPFEEPQPAPPPVSAPPGVGQETVRLDISALQDQMPAAGIEQAAEEETAKLPRWDVEPVPEPKPQEFELEPEEVTPAPVAEIEIEQPEPVAPMASPDYSEDATIINQPSDVVTPEVSEDATIVNQPSDVVAPEVGEDATIVNQPSDVAEPSASEPSPMAGGYVPPAPAAPTEVTPPPSTGFAAPQAAKAAAGTTQVVPPTDIQGPGSAFESLAGGIPDGEEALHEEARRLARLLVSEIRLYNEEIIEEGRRSGNIYERLKDDIDRSRQMYEERIDPRLLESDTDYFRLELVQRLAGGDERLLGY